MKRLAKVEILRCPKHGCYAIAVGGVRVTPSKCCGSWDVLVGWSLDDYTHGAMQTALDEAKRPTGRSRT